MRRLPYRLGGQHSFSDEVKPWKIRFWWATWEENWQPKYAHTQYHKIVVAEPKCGTVHQLSWKKHFERRNREQLQHTHCVSHNNNISSNTKSRVKQKHKHEHDHLSGVIVEKLAARCGPVSLRFCINWFWCRHPKAECRGVGAETTWALARVDCGACAVRRDRRENRVVRIKNPVCLVLLKVVSHWGPSNLNLNCVALSYCAIASASQMDTAKRENERRMIQKISGFIWIDTRPMRLTNIMIRQVKSKHNNHSNSLLGNWTISGRHQMIDLNGVELNTLVANHSRTRVWLLRTGQCPLKLKRPNSYRLWFL